MQLTLDHLLGPGSSILNIYEKWSMLDFFDRHYEKTGLMVYEEEKYRFRLPFQIGELFLSSAPKATGRNQMRLTHWANRHSSVYLNNTLTAIIECEKGYKTVYSQVVGSGKERTLRENLAGKTYFLLRDYPIGVTRFPNIEPTSGRKEVFKVLRGASVQVKVHVNQDWVQEITSIPFIVEYIEAHRDEITIIGTNDTELTFKGFKDIRPNPNYGYIIFDVYDQNNGYTRSFQIMSQKGH